MPLFTDEQKMISVRLFEKQIDTTDSEPIDGMKPEGPRSKLLGDEDKKSDELRAHDNTKGKRMSSCTRQARRR